ncbi:hypothetical protein LTR17_016205 [Elasticomyces elasticus]|nr:hypothetical protein LTR17_016205 [Elasticomyces elasticus]
MFIPALKHAWIPGLVRILLSPYISEGPADDWESRLAKHLATQVKLGQGARKLRILALHGFTQSGEWFRIKLQRIEAHVRITLSRSLLQYPDGIEFLYPSGPLALQAMVKTTVELGPGSWIQRAGTMSSTQAWNTCVPMSQSTVHSTA